MENPSLNIYLLCLAPKYLDLILWALSFGLHWRVDVHEHGPLIIMAFDPLFGLWPLSFFVSSRDRGSRHFMLQNWSKTCKIEVPPKYMCKRENDQ
jgi:hypothetical protein